MRWRGRCLRERHARVNTFEVVIIVVECGDVHTKIWLDQAPVSRFVTDQGFRKEFPVSGKAQECQRIGCKHAGDLEIFVQSGGGDDRARNGSPDCLPRPRSPQKPRARLYLEAGIVVVQDFRPDRYPEFILNDRNLILDKRAVKLVGKLIRIEDDGRDDFQGISRAEASPKSPREILPSRERPVVNEIDVESVSNFPEAGLVPVGPVVISLQLDVGALTEQTSPATE